ncbi:hypothetical protein [Methylobacterium variabile]|jgi:hypothetical protein|uniref:hypothetical protein n=1 Tax=Methylobacterium variabile TaxID=298794 RepID=UPI000A74D40E|nr:hypothetical protein [Methylobacterium variabile]
MSGTWTVERRNLSRSGIAVALGLIVGCVQTGSPRAGLLDRRDAAPAPPSTAEVRTEPVRSSGLAALYTADLTRAVAGEKKVAFGASGGFGEMDCSPPTISGADAASRTLTLTLPEEPAARRRVLAVVTPERGLLEIYSPYADASESEDIMVPSHATSWSKARTRRRFTVSSDTLDGLRPRSGKPEVLFLEAGRYRFALLNGIDAALLKANGTKVNVEAACSFDWTP